MLQALPDGLPVRLVGPYRLLAGLGSGGMGEVHLACDARRLTSDPYRMVAVKTVREDLQVDGEFRVRFRREIAAARAVRSPYAAVLVAGDADAASPWLATEYVPGPSLAEAVDRSGPLPVAAVRELGGDLARALDAIHRAQVLHRDLKPANVLLSAGGPKVIDFGIAQAFDATALTSTGLVVGTPGFMAPEHLEGSRAVVPATDVFCLGALLAFAATGRGPFEDDEMGAVIYRISRADADLSGVPEELREVIGDCLRLDPAERPSAAALAERLAPSRTGVFPWPGGVLSLLAEHGDAARRFGEAAASGTGVAELPTMGPTPVPYSPTALGAGLRPRPAAFPVPSASAADAARKRTRRGRIATGAVALAVLAAVGVVLLDKGENKGSSGGKNAIAGGAGGGEGSGAGRAPAASKSQLVLPYGGTGHTQDFGAGATDRSARAAGWSPWEAKVPVGAGPCVLAGELLVCSGPGGAVTVLRAADGKEAWTKPGRGAEPRSPAWAPAVADGAVHITDAEGVSAYELDSGKKSAQWPHPEGGYVAKGTESLDGVLYTTYVRPDQAAKNLLTARQLTGSKGEVWRASLSGIPDSPVAAGGRVYVPVGTKLWSFDARSGKQVVRGGPSGAGGGCWGVVVHGGAVLCGGGGESGIAVLDARTLKQRRVIADGVAPVVGPAVTAKGVMVLGDGGHLYAYDVRTGRELWRKETEDDGGDLIIAGGQILAGSGLTVSAHTLDGKGTADRTIFEVPKEVASSAGETGYRQALVSGGVLFLVLSEGVVVSGYAP
ncbi:protein kinase [Streptomyces sp. NBC_01142]|uniref:serine/threonine-protein kinase n=1 Tax=Streptomyces sp. NBC_01142 TaxID=2975865 RepID=UPI00225C051C|nr:protein kinase [Streptomyces sp. NBC_01142]MCX4821069.1 protein kinase [Streptomyces sp. NBC_01142]